MKRVIAGMLCASALGAALTAAGQPAKSPRPQPRSSARPPSPAVSAHEPATSSAESRAALLKQYCVGCHNDKSKAGGLTLAAFDAARPEHTPEDAEKVIRKVRAGMMPPPGARRPDAAALNGLGVARNADRRPRRCGRTRLAAFHRLNRAAYARAVRYVLKRVDVSRLAARPSRPRLRHIWTTAFLADADVIVPARGQHDQPPRDGDAARADVRRSTRFRARVEMRPVERLRRSHPRRHLARAIFPADCDYIFKSASQRSYGGPCRASVRAKLLKCDQRRRAALVPINPEMKVMDQTKG